MPVLRSGLFHGKFRMPHLGPDALHRERLHDRIDTALDQGHLLVSAPAGTGKTYALITWAAQHRRHAVAWLTLDEGDRDPVRLLRYALAAVGTTPPGRRIQDRFPVVIGATTVDDALLAHLSEVFAHLDDDVVLVLDNVDAIIGSRSEELIAGVFPYPAGPVRLVLLSRIEPRLGQSRQMLRGQAGELGEDDLAFTTSEIREYLALRDVSLPDGDITTLRERTAGWAAAIELVATAMHNQALPRELPDEVSLATDYLMDEVFAAQTGEVQEFLLRATTADPVCGELADALSGGSQGARTLAQLHHNHVFIHRLAGQQGDDRAWFHWHPMFGAALHRRLVESAPQLALDLHLTAAQWHRSRGSPVEAVRQAMAGHNPIWAAELLSECWLDLAVAGESAVLHSLLDLFTEDERATDPELAIICAFLRLRDRDLDRACRCATEAQQHAVPLPADRRRAVDAIATIIRLHVATLTGSVGPEGLRELARELIEQIRTPAGFIPVRERVLLAHLLHHLGAYESVHLDTDPRPHLHAALEYAPNVGLTQLTLRCQAQLALAELASGRLHQAKAAALEVVGPDPAHGWTGPHAATTAYLALAGVELLHGDLPGALQHLSQAGAHVEPTDRVNRFRIQVLTQVTLLAAGRVTHAREQFAGLNQLMAGWEPPPLGLAIVDILRAEQLMAEHDPDAAIDLLLTDESAPTSPGALFRRTWVAELLLRTGHPGKAKAMLTEDLPAVTGTPAVGFGHVAHALSLESVGDHEGALEALERALGEASPEGYLHPFIRHGPLVRPLLEELLDRGTPHEPLAREVLDQLSPASHDTTISAAYFEPLTPRECQVLRALQGTRPNEEVAKRLFISENTLRTHIKHIHRKLGTSSRREAIARGRELAII
ncbi:MAG: LuxR C-terminal-related transcriptional regulator [Dermatophilaceae bacterium]|nr:LuxR C-terminal-related transcriptional regulator [Intrasporangiaceae bacterium]